MARTLVKLIASWSQSRMGLVTRGLLGAGQTDGKLMMIWEARYKLGLEAFIPANLSFKILHCVAPRSWGSESRGLFGAQCSVAGSRGGYLKFYTPSPSGHNVTATGRAGVTGQMALLACKCGPAKPSKAALIRWLRVIVTGFVTEASGANFLWRGQWGMGPGSCYR